MTCLACGETAVAPDGACPTCGASGDAEVGAHVPRTRAGRGAVRSALPLFSSRPSTRRWPAHRVRQGSDPPRVPDPVTPALDFDEDAADGRSPDRARGDASIGQRLRAGLIDGLILMGMDAAVVVLTLRAAALPPSDVATLPLLPLAAFLLLLDGGYFVAFLGLGGQTVGEMITGVSVRVSGGAR